MTTVIRDVWQNNPNYWFPVEKDRATIDRILYDRFRTYDYTSEDVLGQVLYLDQLCKHFSRIEPMNVEEARIQARAIVMKIPFDQLMGVAEDELVWFLMPLKHLGNFDTIFTMVDLWLLSKHLLNFPLLHRFFTDTYKKAYGRTQVAAKIVRSEGPKPYSPTICETHPPLLETTIPAIAKPLINKFTSNEPVAVSLSGGVDSMLLLTLLKRTGRNVIAIHIVYGNRAESEDERNFLETFCHKLEVPLYIYAIEWLKREGVCRAFYERMTRDIRFHVYKSLDFPVFLGHIQEDAIENIWTNLAKGNHLEYLPKLREVSMEDNVTLVRPWLNISKATIFRIANSLGLPYLKNTTPAWSNRGKFRERFHKATKEQYGDSVDNTILDVAYRLANQAEMLDRLLFQPIRESAEGGKIDITRALELSLDGTSWHRILKDQAHAKGLGMPSMAAANDFAQRASRGFKDGQIVQLAKHLPIRISMEHGKTYVSIDGLTST
jgi:tRNA(Ile)-lysidine synthetase-like protein